MTLGRIARIAFLLSVAVLLFAFIANSGGHIDPATATSVPIGPGLFAVVSYPVHINGGTGKFAGATGDFTNIGEVLLPHAPDTAGGTTVFRYSGQVCFADKD